MFNENEVVKVNNPRLKTHGQVGRVGGHDFLSGTYSVVLDSEKAIVIKGETWYLTIAVKIVLNVIMNLKRREIL